MAYKFLEHTADVKFQSSGETLEECFIEAGKALNETIYGNTEVLKQEEKIIEVSGKDFESLLYNFLEDFLFFLDAENFLISNINEIEIDKENFNLKAVVSGDKADNYKFTNDVKAITFNEIFIRHDDKWTCQVVLDV